MYVCTVGGGGYWVYAVDALEGEGVGYVYTHIPSFPPHACSKVQHTHLIQPKPLPFPHADPR